MKKILLMAFAAILSMAGFAQKSNTDSLLRAKDSTLKAIIHADSIKVEKDYNENLRWQKIKDVGIRPVIDAGLFSSVVPVKDPTEIPDPKQDYKLLFELTFKNPDSVANELNYGLVEIARIINLHVASGIPVNKIFPVIVMHGGVLKAVSTNAYYKEHLKMDNPNLKLIDDLGKLGSKFIACGQAMAFLNIKKEDLLPVVKISLTAQTALSNYQLKGYVKYDVNVDK